MTIFDSRQEKNYGPRNTKPLLYVPADYVIFLKNILSLCLVLERIGWPNGPHTHTQPATAMLIDADALGRARLFLISYTTTTSFSRQVPQPLFEEEEEEEEYIIIIVQYILQLLLVCLQWTIE